MILTEVKRYDAHHESEPPQGRRFHARLRAVSDEVKNL